MKRLGLGAENCKHFAWPIAHLYKINQTNPRILAPTYLWRVEDTGAYQLFRRVIDRVSVRCGVELPGFVLERRTSVWRMSWLKVV
jgi:hypothetical protein